MSRGVIGCAWKAGAAGLDREGEGARHGDRVAGARNRGVEQHGVIAQLHHGGGVGRRAKPRVDDQRNVRKMRPQRPQAERLLTPRPEPIGAAQGISTRQPASSSFSATTRSSVV